MLKVFVFCYFNKKKKKNQNKKKLKRFCYLAQKFVESHLWFLLNPWNPACHTRGTDTQVATQRARGKCLAAFHPAKSVIALARPKARRRQVCWSSATGVGLVYPRAMTGLLIVPKGAPPDSAKKSSGGLFLPSFLFSSRDDQSSEYCATFRTVYVYFDAIDLLIFSYPKSVIGIFKEATLLE